MPQNAQFPRVPDSKGIDTKKPEPMMDASGVTMARQYALPKTGGDSNSANIARAATTNKLL